MGWELGGGGGWLDGSVLPNIALSFFVPVNLLEINSMHLHPIYLFMQE